MHSLIPFASASSQTYDVPIKVQYELTTDENNVVVLKEMSRDIGVIPPCYDRDQSKHELAVKGQCCL